ncbi:molybdopterin-guanine dinucleotide biosynthesis adapter protein [mine drainage metagenome]|uniref:Molybdopterin-guanine dinucleotide biosynthesis adapter protein n=1 Tax=mine drainage metagenome TaxID=410659 RepID=A0A1J5SKC9_9ZZZZ
MTTAINHTPINSDQGNRMDKPILSFCASGSGIGKTTLLTKLIPILTERGLRISVIKHAHHSFDIDYPGKDSYRLREAGAVQMLLGSRKRWALMTELSRIADRDKEEDISLSELLAQLDQRLIDLILVEGFRYEGIPKIEIYRPSVNPLLLADNDDTIIAVASDGETDTKLPVLNLNNAEEIAEFILKLVNR